MVYLLAISNFSSLNCLYLPLNYLISSNCTVLDPERLETIRHWVLPIIKERILKVGSFANYLRKFIPNAPILLAPFYSLVDTKTYPKKNFQRHPSFNLQIYLAGQKK